MQFIAFETMNYHGSCPAGVERAELISNGIQLAHRRSILVLVMTFDQTR